jgi:uncharacterized protein YggE
MSKQRQIAVTGTGLASGSPDQCTLHISLNHMAEGAADALTGTADIATKAIAALGEARIEQCEVRTVGLSVQDFFDQGKQKITARIGSYQLDVVIRPINEAGTVLASLSSTVGDALQVRGIQLTIEDPEPLKTEARRLAIQDAKRRAMELSGEAGVRLGVILSIQDENASSVPFAQRAMPIMSGSFAAANVPIEAGSVSAVSNVTLVYAIEK